MEPLSRRAERHVAQRGLCLKAGGQNLPQSSCPKDPLASGRKTLCHVQGDSSPYQMQRLEQVLN